MPNAHTVIVEIPQKNQQYQILVDWENIEDVPDNLITLLELVERGYLNKQQVQKIINDALNKITIYQGESEEL